MWRPSLWFHSCSNQICLKSVFFKFSVNNINKQRCFQTVPVVFNFYSWTKKTALFFFFFSVFSFCRFGSWVVHLEVLNQILWWNNNNMGKKENDIFLGVYFLLLNKVLKSIWVDMWKKLYICLLPPRMDIQYSMQLTLAWWEAIPEVFMIYHAKDDAEPAICTIMTPPVKSTYNMFCVIYSVLPLSLKHTRISHIWEYIYIHWICTSVFCRQAR